MACARWRGPSLSRADKHTRVYSVTVRYTIPEQGNHQQSHDEQLHGKTRYEKGCVATFSTYLRAFTSSWTAVPLLPHTRFQTSDALSTSIVSRSTQHEHHDMPIRLLGLQCSTENETGKVPKAWASGTNIISPLQPHRQRCAPPRFIVHWDPLMKEQVCL